MDKGKLIRKLMLQGCNNMQQNQYEERLGKNFMRFMANACQCLALFHGQCGIKQAEKKSTGGACGWADAISQPENGTTIIRK
nr:hypothetical protein [Methylocucumis oryzae]